MICRRGDVVLVRYPHSDLTTLTTRPALLVQDEGVPTGLPQSIVALITSNLGRTGPTRVRFMRESSDGEAMGLPTYSVVVTDNLATVLDRELDQVIGRCPAMDRVGEALRSTLGP